MYISLNVENTVGAFLEGFLIFRGSVSNKEKHQFIYIFSSCDDTIALLNSEIQTSLYFLHENSVAYNGLIFFLRGYNGLIRAMSTMCAVVCS